MSSIQSESRKVWYEYEAFNRITKQIIGNTVNENNAVYFATYEYETDGKSVAALTAERQPSVIHQTEPCAQSDIPTVQKTDSSTT